MPELTMTTMLVGLGAVALVFFWIHMLLIAAAAWKDLRGLREHLASFGPLQIATVHGEVSQRVVQVGRSKGDGQIHFHDRAYECRHEGLTLHFEPGETPVAISADDAIELWLEPARFHAQARCQDADTFDAAYAAAQKARGYSRDIDVTVETSQRVWAAENPKGRWILATQDPFRFLRSRAVMALGLTAGVAVLLVGCTAAVVWPPLLGMVGKAGALAALVGHQAMQLAGKHVHDAMRPPSTAFVRGVWKRPK